MRKSCRKITEISVILFLAGLFVFNFTSCGLDEFYVLDARPIVDYSPIATEDSDGDYSQKYFTFRTNESSSRDYIGSDSAFVFMGTDIYYKIYSSYSKMTSEIASLYSLSESENYTNAATRLIEATGYNYQKLECEGYTKSPLISATGTNKKILVRLTDYFEVDREGNIEQQNSSRIEVDNQPLTGAGNISKPRRNGIIGNCSFNFGRESKDSKLNPKPKKDDPDYNETDFTEEGKYYISLYAVAVGRDTTYTTYYSNIAHLGTVKIDSDNENN